MNDSLAPASGENSSSIMLADRSEQKTEVLHGNAGQPTDRVLINPRPTPPPLTRALGHFEILEPIGRGGFGIVVKAFDHTLRRVVAIKMMPEEMAATSPARKRFVREARAAAAIRHDNVICIHAVEEQPVPYLVMEFVPDGSLQRYLDETGPLEVKEVLCIGAQIARGLTAAHATGVVHRDIKPANVLLEREPSRRAKLTDFGIACAADDASLTQSGMIVGTPMYMAPEQARGERIDHRADLFSLGSVLYTMVSGRPPFRATNSLAVLKRVSEETPRPIQEIMPETPQWLCDIIAKLHAPDPNDRFQTAAEVADLLESCRVALEAGRPVMSRVPHQIGRRRKWVGVAVGTVLAAVTLAGILFGTNWPSTQPTTPLATSPEQPTEPPTPTAPQPNPPPSAKPAEILPDKYINALDMKFVRIPAGTSRLGGGDGFAGAETVMIERDFYMAVYEVTQEDWEKVMGPGRNPSRFSRSGMDKAAVADIPDELLKRFPVEYVSWDEAQEFIWRLNSQTKETGWVYRLPRAAEWEYACRGGPNRPESELGQDFYAGAPTRELKASQANFAATGLRRPCPVGSYPANRLGLHDMHGNVFELCDDIILTATGWQCSLRGGYWVDQPDTCRAKWRGTALTEGRHPGEGFRLVRVPVTEYTRPYDPLLSPSQQIEVFTAELKRLNPGLTSPIFTATANNRVVSVRINDAKPIRDISPIRLLPHLETVNISGCRFTDLTPLRGLPLRELVLNNNWAINDLSPLKEMQLEVFEVWGFQGSDLSPLQGMPLRVLNCGGVRRKLDITPLRGLPLKYLCLNCTAVEDLSPLKGADINVLLIDETQIRDLSPLRGMKLKELYATNAPITDFTPLRGMPLVSLDLNFVASRDTELLKSFPGLTTINKKPAAQFWKEQKKK